MNKITKKAILISLISILFTVFVAVFDRQPIGPNGSVVGLATINLAFRNLVGEGTLVLYTITEICGYLAILVCVFFAFFGLGQAIKRKNLFKMDRDIVALGCIYVATIILYVFFEKVAVNYRPMIMPGASELEASFPSSHTMLILTVFGTALIEIVKRVKNPSFRNALIVFSGLILGLTVSGRLLCGVHWLTDIFGGIFYSLALISWFIAFAFKYE